MFILSCTRPYLCGSVPPVDDVSGENSKAGDGSISSSSPTMMEMQIFGVL
jgi:hypothetical protein